MSFVKCPKFPLFLIIFRVGFTEVQGIDKTAEFNRILKEEVERFEPTKEEFVKVSRTTSDIIFQPLLQWCPNFSGAQTP